MAKLSGRVAVVTGAASGIGRALAGRLAAEGAALALCDVNEVGLAETARGISGVRVTTRKVDVSKEAEVQAFAAAVEQDHGRADLLFNNAGVALHGTFEELSSADFDWLIGINFHGVVHGTRAFLPLLVQSDAGRLVNVSSVYGIVAPSGQTAYSAAKFAVRGFSEALRHEFAGSRLKITVVHPGGIRTNIATAARAPAGISADEAKTRADLMNKVALRMPPERAADIIVRAAIAGKPRVLVGTDAKLLDGIVRLAPGGYWSLLGRAMDPKGWFKSKKASR